ncbi:2,3-diaminopropionate biosynthesis protein SbnB [Kutzneria buriramensis]|uniref:Ornithine cyclodeaminase n=1 Tax=Kutzneria buriramensis TaxID=1045776 RepID=A0A3E0HQC8_9PSEU|nr:2,3-diaminopropionate biosynthesis protein SbnB [Kutzneria buriramensis]REH48470.1 ornithine cyclodeaminase [Kutzneria buriramensis]
MGTPTFSVIGGAVVQEMLRDRHRELVDVVEHAYRLHGRAQTVNPPSYFLTYPDRPGARTIALPASVRGDIAVDGIKWISSFPANIRTGLPRASAVLVLNDPETGYPFGCLESSIISATRTAASAVLAAATLARGDRPRRVTYFGTGLIARYVHEFLVGTGWEFDEVGVYDLSADYARRFREHIHADSVTVHTDPRSAIEKAGLVVFATTAATPHVHDPSWFAHHPLVLHLSLRDLAPEVILAATNVLDDVDHCLKANTSPHLAEQLTGSRDFVDATLYDVLTGAVTPRPGKPLVFSPFGLGVLDLAVGKFVYDEAARRGRLQRIDGFFAELSRYN